MRVLCVGNMYPPHHLGGYELVWRSAVEHLRARGHEVRVLTTDHRQPGLASAGAEEAGVARELRWYWHDHEFPRLSPREVVGLERHNAAVFDRHLADLSPSVIAWWAMGGMSLSLIERARRAGVPGVSIAHDDWLLYGPRADRWTRLVRRAGPAARVLESATGLPARFDPASIGRWLFVSEATRDAAAAAGWRLPGGAIAPSGFDAEVFAAPAPEHAWEWRLLYVGRIDARKGIETAIAALTRLPAQARLTIVGDGDAAELARLRARVAELDLAERVVFAGPAARADLPAIYVDADAVIFPVTWEEPWGLIPLEAMAMARPVVATGRGGSAEYLSDGENCLLFGAGDEGSLARALERLAADPALRARLRAGGLDTAPQHTEDRFNARVAEAVEAAGALPTAPGAL